ncbi:MAG: Asp-tRNA(Asn)/Glu-tRNA(Gln) amidotransferase subunit GatC [Patescibacteria group bacterium]|nr:Asp-tRNA(Asn)/Glu-tRNA(Gln) amidotransferase subunit GatC [Patescibacteria group bacterium]
MASTRSVITKETIKKIAALANIDLSDNEIAKYRKEFEGLLKYIDKIQDVDTTGLDFETHVELRNVLREDKVTKSLTQKQALSCSKYSNQDGYFVIPAVLNK